MDSRRHKDHQQTCWWCHLKCRRCRTHDKPDRPEAVSRKGKRHYGAAPESGTKIEQIGHPFEGAVDTPDQWNLLDPSFCPGNNTLSNYMGGDGANSNNDEQKQDEADSGTLLDSDVPRKIVRSEEHTSELQSLRHLVCRLLL